jgi:hypothetical protein
VPLILRAYADVETLELTIEGVNFGTATPKAKLAGTLLEMTSASASDGDRRDAARGSGPRPTSSSSFAG